MLCFGWDIWQAYFEETLHFQIDYLWEKSNVVSYYEFMMPGFYANSYMMPENSKAIFLLIYAAILIPVGYKIGCVVHKDQSLSPKTLLGISLATALITPYFFNYDMTAIMLALLLYVSISYKPMDHKQPLFLGLILLFLWSLPLTTMILRGRYETDLTVTISEFFVIPSLIMGISFYLLFFKKEKPPEIPAV